MAEKSTKGETKVMRPPNEGWLEKTLDDQEIDYLWRCIESKKKGMKRLLAGNITGSYRLQDKENWFFTNTIKPLIVKYVKEFGNPGDDLGMNQLHPYCLHSFWVNYQNQQEFNPLHDHAGVYSFTIWMKIPTRFDEQIKNPIAFTANNKQISNFSFTYVNILGDISSYTYNMCPEMEGRMVFFRSQLSHQVYPFYNCKEERISIAGNVTANTKIVL